MAPLVVSIDLCLRDRTQDECLTYLLRWAAQRSSLHLCCKKLKIFTMPIQNIKKVLNMVQLDSILEVEVNCTWKLSTLGMFAPYLGQMSNVQRLVLSHIHMTPSKEEKQHVARFTSQFLRLHHLQKLSMDSPSFLEGRLDQMLRWEVATPGGVTVNARLGCQVHCLICCSILSVVSHNHPHKGLGLWKETPCQEATHWRGAQI